MHEINLIKYAKISFQKWRKLLYDYNLKMKENEMDLILIKP
jgi:hypothetical protein